MSINWHAPTSRLDFWSAVKVVWLLGLSVSIAGLGWSVAHQPSRYDAMKAATVELSFLMKDDKGALHKGHGSGVIISRNFILTVNHVGSAAGREEVLFSNGKTGWATMIWSDPARDAAIMVLDKATTINPARLASAPVTTGQEIWSAGYPLDLPLSVQHGEVVSDVISKVQMDEDNGNSAAVYTNITMAPGDSGGPVFNTSGEVVGLNDFVTQYAGFGGMVAMQAILADVRAVTGIQ